MPGMVPPSRAFWYRLKLTKTQKCVLKTKACWPFTNSADALFIAVTAICRNKFQTEAAAFSGFLHAALLAQRNKETIANTAGIVCTYRVFFVTLIAP